MDGGISTLDVAAGVQSDVHIREADLGVDLTHVVLSADATAGLVLSSSLDWPATYGVWCLDPLGLEPVGDRDHRHLPQHHGHRRPRPRLGEPPGTQPGVSRMPSPGQACTTYRPAAAADRPSFPSCSIPAASPSTEPRHSPMRGPFSCFPLTACADTDVPAACADMCQAGAALYGDCLDDWGATWADAGYAHRGDFVEACETWSWEMGLLEEDAVARGEDHARQAQRSRHVPTALQRWEAPEATCEAWTGVDWNTPPWTRR